MAKEMFPASATAWMMLCDRLGVDNSGRTLHGAARCRAAGRRLHQPDPGQDALLIGRCEEATAAPGSPHRPERRIRAARAAANEQELAAHEDLLTQIDKSSGGKQFGAKPLQTPEKAVP